MSESVGYSQADLLSVKTLRALSADLSFNAGSGHPGAPMGMAPMAHVLFTRFMRSSPKSNKSWVGRDRFVLSNGHACALQYVLLHLLGYDITMDGLKNFRKLDGNTPGHPESQETPGIEVTTGPLGQGFASAVGLAIAEAHMAATYNKPGFKLFNNRTFVFFGDGCAMEGVASEAASLAGHLKLGKLIALYDDNSICIDGSTDSTFTEDVDRRFEAYGWHVQHVQNGNTDMGAIEAAIENAIAEESKPSMIRVTTTIGYGSNLQGTASVHGNPLKEDDLQQFKKKAGIAANAFEIPKEVLNLYRARGDYGSKEEQDWESLFSEYANEHATLHAELSRRLRGELPADWKKRLPTFSPTDKAIATRKASELVLSSLNKVLPEIISGSADLTSSNLTRWKDAVDFQTPASGIGSFEGRYLRWGALREHAMGAAMNGIAAYGANLVPLAGTFLNFVSYAAPALRLSALSELRAVWIATHDSIGLGGDGPTHQPIETLAHFRSLPNTHVWRPADGNETSAAYCSAITSVKTPSVLALGRQEVPHLENSTLEKALLGGYTILEHDDAQLTIVSSGSEVSLSLDTAAVLRQKHQIQVRVVSMPCMEVFDRQPLDYRLAVLKPGIPILSVEALCTNVWQKFSHQQFGIDRFGASGTPQSLFEKFQFTVDGVSKRVLRTLEFYNDKGYLHSPVSRAFEPII